MTDIESTLNKKSIDEKAIKNLMIIEGEGEGEDETNHLYILTQNLTDSQEFIDKNTMITDAIYNTYFNSNFIKNNPTRYLTDVFCIGLNFNFIKDSIIYPEFKYYIKNKLVIKKIASQITQINDFNKIEYGPFYYMNQPDDETIRVVELIVKNNYHKVIFRKFYLVPDYRDYSFNSKFKDRILSFKFITSSCYSLPGYRNPNIDCYFKMAEISREFNPEYILCTGDIVYLEPLNITSEYAVQGAYDQLKSFEPIKNLWSNHTWICSNDDHEFGFNDTLLEGPNIQMLRNTMRKNFPLDELTRALGTRCGSFTTKNITWIQLDDISDRVFNKEYTGIGYNKFSSMLGDLQLTFLVNALSNVKDNFGLDSLCFILVGRSMFANLGDTFVFCPQERDTIFSHIKFLGLRNVCFFCGDSHQSDVSEFVINLDSNQIIREIRNSPIGSRPRNIPNDNPYQVPGSFVGGINNFGLVSVEGTEKNYNINLQVYTKNGIVYNYGWNSRY